MSSFVQVAAVLGSLASTVSAHGYVQGIVAGGAYYTGYNPSFQYQATPPKVIGWSDPADQGNGFVQDYNSPDIICHLNATPAMSHAVIAAGDKIEFQWTDWPSSHHGPVLTYLAKCAGDCESVDKTSLEFFKIDEVGLVDDTTVPGTWGSDQLIANNNSWVSQIPSTIAPGNYVVRHEIIALHSAGTSGGAQPYPQCMNLQITGSGTASPAGIKGEQLYQSSALVENIYQSLSTYVIPGPSLIAGASAVASQTALAITAYPGTGVVGSAAPPSAAPASTSAAAVTSASVTSNAAVVSETSSATTSYSAPAETSSEAVPATTSAASSYNAPTPASSSSEAAPATSAAASYSAPAPASSSSEATPATSAAPSYSAPAVTSSAAASSTAAATVPDSYTPIASLTAALPSSVLTSAVPTAIPTQTPAGYNGSLPSQPLPEGMTFKQLLEWVHYLFAQYYAEHKGRQNSRAHARDLKAF